MKLFRIALVLFFTIIFQFLKAQSNEIIEIKGKKGLNSETGSVILPVEFDEINEDGEILKVKKGNKVGFFSMQGAEIFPLEFDSVNYFTEGFAVAFHNSKCGVIDNKGKRIIPIEFESISIDFDNKVFIIGKNSKLGFANIQGTMITSQKYESINFSKPVFATVKENGKWGAVNEKNEEIIPCEFDLISPDDPKDGLVTVKKNFIYYLYDVKNNLKFDYEFIGTPVIEDGLIIARQNGLFGYINPKGEEVIKPQFSSGSGFRNGIAEVVLNGIQIRINKSGRKI